MKRFKNVGTWWNDRNINLIEVENEVFALNGWNGEKYLNSWKCIDEDNMVASEEEYVITPIYNGDEIVGYEVM